MMNYGQMSWSKITIMIKTERILFWLLLLCASLIQGDSDGIIIRGVPGEDYPNYTSIPRTSFRCSEQHHIPGLYADIETRCQVFHHCYEHRQESFLCPLGTVFNQAILACDYWYSADCSSASLYYGSESPHQALIYETESYFVPPKTSSGNLLDKMASLYEEDDGFVMPNVPGNKADSVEENLSFSGRDRPMIIETKPIIESRNLIDNTDHYGRNDIGLNELPEEYDYVQNNEVEDNIKYFDDSFEGSGQSSGESKEPEEEAQGDNLWPSNAISDFDKQQFSKLYEEHIEQKTIPHSDSYYKDEPQDHLADFSYANNSSSKESPESGEKLVRRNSEYNANFSSRKYNKRKPLIRTSESQANNTTFDLPMDKVNVSSIEPVNQGTTSASVDSASNFPKSSVTFYKAKRRRKPVMINLEESLQYNFDGTSHSDKSAIVNYEVNHESEIPGVSIAAQEISVKLIPSEINRKRKPTGKYSFNHYNSENEEKTESSTISYVTSSVPNIHYEPTFPTFIKELGISDDEIPMVLNRINAIRKKNKIRIIDSDDNLVGIDNGVQTDIPPEVLRFQHEKLPQPSEEEYQNFKHLFLDTAKETKVISAQELIHELSLKEDEGKNDPSYFTTEHNKVKLNIFPDTHEILQESQQDKTESSTISYVTSPVPNNHYEPTFPTFIKELGISDDEIPMVINRINAIRKKNKIRIIDSDDNLVGMDNGVQTDTPLEILRFQHEKLPQPSEEEYQNFKHLFLDTAEETKVISAQELIHELSLKSNEGENDRSYFTTEHNEVKLNIFPDTHEILQETQHDGFEPTTYDEMQDERYFTTVEPISDISTSTPLEIQYTEDSVLTTEHNNGKLNIFPDTHEILQETRHDGFELTTYDKMQDEKYFTTAETISDISTRIPLEIQYTEDSVANFHLIPNFNFEPEYDHSGISKNTWIPAPEILEGNHVGGQFDSGSFDFNPSYHIFLEDLMTTESPHSEDVKFQTIMSESSENVTEIEQLTNAELEDNILHNNNSNSEDFMNNSFAHSGEMTTTSDILVDEELQDYLSNSNANSDSNTTMDDILTESKHTEDPVPEDVTEKEPLEIQRNLIDESVDFDAMEKTEEGGLQELNANSPEPINIEHKGYVESIDIQDAIDSSEDFSETSSQLNSASPVATNSILKTSENPPFWNDDNTFHNGDFNSFQKISNNMGIKSDPSQNILGSQLKTTEKSTVSKPYSVSLPTNQGSTRTAKKIPSRNARALPYQMNFNTEAFGSQYLYPGYDFENGAFYARTGNFLESPKISKLISFGKNLLRSKRAKFRILSGYVNSFKSNQ